MPRLIVLNGPPGSGKSTLARLYAERHPLTLNLDIDRVRDMLGQWRSRAGEAGLLARDIALAAARTHLAAGRDVVIAQFVARMGFLEQAESVAQECGARFHEVVLLDSKENSLRRFAERGPSDGREVSEEELARMYDRLMAVVASRPGAKVVPTRAGEIEQAYRDFLAVL